jgi:hypothetical protein
MRVSLPSRTHRFTFALLPILAGACCALALQLAGPALASESEPCPNEPYRVASDSTQLPDCRAYELVSPADAGGTVGGYPLDSAGGVFLQAGLGDNFVASDGSLDQQLRGDLDVQGNGEDVFWNSRATPPGTGALQDAGAWDPFSSARTSTGWSTRDLLPGTQQIQNNPGGTVKVFLGASSDGSSALVLSQLALDPSAFANPQQAALGEWRGVSIYRVSTDGAFAPQLVTHGEFPLPENKDLLSLTGSGPFQELSASPDLKVVTFRSSIPLESNDSCPVGNGSGVSSGTVYSWNASSIDRLAHVIFRFEGRGCSGPNVAGAPAVLPDGSPILMPNPAGNPEMPASGPLVENSPDGLEPNALTPLAGPAGGTLLSVTPDSSMAYVLEREALVTQDTSGGGQIYAVGLQAGVPEGGLLPLPGNTESVTCISCSTDQGDVTYVGTSKDGAHVLFTTAGAEPGLWEWDAASGAQRLTSATDLTPEDVVVSNNGQYVVALTSAALLPAKDTNTGPDLYELSAGQPPTLITSGTSADSYELYNAGVLAGGVSDDGQRVVYNARPPGEAGGQLLPNVIDEWDAGQTTQLSPSGSAYEYSVQAVAGDQLQDVFFIANDVLVPWDLNAGQADIYDARAGGGFPFCTPGNPGPPPGVERCAAATSNSDPTVPPPPGYGANLIPPSVQLAGLPADTSQLAPSTSKPKALTRAQLLAKALKTCKRKPKKQRAACERQARSRYATTKKKGKGKR